MKYFPVSSINIKLSKAARKCEVLYIQGGIGIGKTAAVSYYLRRKKAIWFDGEQGFLEKIPEGYPVGDEIIVVDNISCIRDFRSKDFILQIIRQGGRQIILIGRGDLPDWLATLSAQVPFRFASREDFLMDRGEWEKALSKELKHLENETLDRILRVAYDNPLLLTILNSRVVDGILTDENFERARLSYYYVLDDRFFNLLDKEERAVMIALSSFDHFSVEMARTVTINPHIERTFERLFLHDACLVHKGQDYEIPEPYLSYLRWKQTLVMEPYKRSDIFHMAAAYSIGMDDLFSAVDYYQKAGERDLVAETVLRICDDTELVVRNLERINTCLNMLTMEQSLKEPLIMATRSMIYSLEMNRSRSEVWYERLEEFANHPDLGRTDRNESAFYLAYLDLILPHRSSTQWVERLHRYLDAKRRWNGQRMIPSVTLLGRSLLNGLFDFSRLIEEKGLIGDLITAAKQDKYAMSEMTIIIIKLLLQEIAIEREEVDEMVFNTQINRVILESERKGWDDLCLVAIIYFAKMKVIRGDALNTEKIHRELAKRINKDPLLTNALQTINVWINLQKGEHRMAEEWLLHAPDSRVFFSLIDRNKYILKARIHIMKGDYEKAYILLNRLNDVFKEYNRDYLCIKVDLLMAILFYRKNSSRWQVSFMDALIQAEHFGYVRVIADEGAAVLPLFDNLPEKDRKGLNQKWFEKTERFVREMADYYPNYLQEKKSEDIPLTKTEKKVLNYISQGMGSGNICEQLHITYSGLKYTNGIFTVNWEFTARRKH